MIRVRMTAWILQPLADQTRKVYQVNYGGEVRLSQAETKRPWWKIWH